MKLYIRNMVCNRCNTVVKTELENLGFHTTAVELGYAEILEELTDYDKVKVAEKLQLLGFELLDDKANIVVEQIKNLIVDLVHHQNLENKINLSHYLAENLSQDYNTLSNLFSKEEGKTIEHYYISQKIEKVKELLMYDELTLSEIAFQLNYTDVSHLSNQFKKTTGLTPTKFKKLGGRIEIDKI